MPTLIPTRRSLLKLALAARIGELVGISHARAQNDAPATSLRGEGVKGMEPIDTFLLEFLQRNRLRGAEIVIVRRDRLVYARSTGYLFSKTDALLECPTMVPIGSVTKFLTALGVMKLVEDKKVGLDTPVLSYLPESLIGGLPITDVRWKTVTIRQLLQMDAGISQDLAPMWKFRSQLKSRRDAYQMIFKSALVYEPGAHQDYNNCNFSILGDVIEAASGRKWKAFVLEEILKPIGISRYPSFDEIRFPDGDVDARWDSGSAGIGCLSLLDLVKVVSEFSKVRSKIPLTLKTRELMLTPPPPPLRRNADGSLQMGYYGLGLMGVTWENRGVAFSHGGSLVNAKTFFNRLSDGTILAGFFCGELQNDPTSSGQWTFSGELLKVIEGIKVWPTGSTL